MLLNNRLKRLRADEHSLKAVIAELITATEIAERAIGGLKHAVRDVNENLGNQLTSATQMSDISSASSPNATTWCAASPRSRSRRGRKTRPPRANRRRSWRRRLGAGGGAASLSSAKAVAAAAQAFSERRRTGGLAA